MAFLRLVSVRLGRQHSVLHRAAPRGEDYRGHMADSALGKSLQHLARYDGVTAEHAYEIQRKHRIIRDVGMGTRPHAEQGAAVLERIESAINAFEVRDRVVLRHGLGLDAHGKADPLTGRSGARFRISLGVKALIKDKVYCAGNQTEYDRFRNRLLDQLATRLESHHPVALFSSRAKAAMERLIEGNRSSEVLTSLRNRLPSVDDADKQLEIFAWIARAELARDQEESATDALRSACELARPEEDADLAEVVHSLSNRLISSNRGVEADHLFSSLLVVCSNSGLLWRVSSSAKWYSGDYVGALAGLKMALDHGYAEHSVLHARGQILAELGRYEDAISDLLRCINETERGPFSVAYAKSALAYCYGMIHQPDQWERYSQESVEIAPENAWHYYRKAIYLSTIGDQDGAADAARKAFNLEAPALIRSQRERLSTSFGTS